MPVKKKPKPYHIRCQKLLLKVLDILAKEPNNLTPSRWVIELELLLGVSAAELVDVAAAISPMYFLEVVVFPGDKSGWKLRLADRYLAKKFVEENGERIHGY